MNSYSTSLIRIKGIAGMLYRNRAKTKTIVVYGPGAPILPDDGNLPDAPIIMSFRTDLLVPDYIGYGRSDGKCTPKNCIKTFLQLYDELLSGSEGVNHYHKEKVSLRYERIIFIGRSFGGSYVPLLPRFNKNIKELGVIYPAVDNAACGSKPGEESNEDFMRMMAKDGYCYLYRGILSQVWAKHLKNQDGLSPMDNIKYLKEARLFIGHGLKDQCIHYSQSKIYYKKIVQMFPDRKNQFRLRLYPKTGHEPKTSNKAVQDCLRWLGVKNK